MADLGTGGFFHPIETCGMEVAVSVQKCGMFVGTFPDGDRVLAESLKQLTTMVRTRASQKRAKDRVSIPVTVIANMRIGKTKDISVRDLTLVGIRVNTSTPLLRDGDGKAVQLDFGARMYKRLSPDALSTLKKLYEKRRKALDAFDSWSCEHGIDPVKAVKEAQEKQRKG